MLLPWLSGLDFLCFRSYNNCTESVELKLEWHEPKRQKTMNERGLDFGLAREVFLKKKGRHTMTNKRATDELRAAIETLPDNDDVWTEDDLTGGRVKFIGSGHSAAIAHERKTGGRPKAKDKKILVSIRLPQSVVAQLRASGSGWQTRASELIVDGVKSGKLEPSL